MIFTFHSEHYIIIWSNIPSWIIDKIYNSIQERHNRCMLHGQSGPILWHSMSYDRIDESIHILLFWNKLILLSEHMIYLTVTQMRFNIEFTLFEIIILTVNETYSLGGQNKTNVWTALLPVARGVLNYFSVNIAVQNIMLKMMYMCMIYFS